MVNTSLDRKYRASQRGSFNYEPLPDGDYKVKVVEIEPWKESVKTIQVIKREENGQPIKDEKGKNVTETVNNCVFYNCKVKFEVVEGEYKGRFIFHNLTTHPNMDWSIDNFLYAIGVPEITAGQIQANCVGKTCIGNVYTDTYTKTTQNKETGLDEEVERKINKFKSLKPLNNSNQTESAEPYNSLGI